MNFNEHKTLNKLFILAQQRGWVAGEIWDGGEFIHTDDIDTIIEQAEAVEECWIYFYKQLDENVRRKHWVYFIWGNGNDGWDCVTDYSFNKGDDFDDMMNELFDWQEAQQNG